MPTVESVKAKIQGLINLSNETTGQNDTDLTSAVNHLIEGYGRGGEDPEIPTGEQTFTIPEFENNYGTYGTFTVEAGTTWGDWLATNPFNDESVISTDSDGIHHLPNGLNLYDSNDTLVLPTDYIKSGTYSFQDSYYVGKKSIVATQLNGTRTYTFWYKKGWTWADWANDTDNKNAEGTAIISTNNAVTWHGASWYLCDVNGNIIPSTEIIDDTKQYWYDVVTF